MSIVRKAQTAGSRKGPRYWPLLALASSLAASATSGACLGNPDPTIRALQDLADENAAVALSRAQTEVAELTRTSKPNAQRLASLYAVEAQAFSVLERDDEAMNAAAAGLKLATVDTDPVHLNLLSAYAENVHDEAGIAAALKSIETAHAMQVRGSLADVCLQSTRGLLQYRQDRNDLAIVSLTQAYSASSSPEYALARISAAGNLSSVLSSMGDNAQALALNQEVIDADIARGATITLSVDYFLRGRILLSMEQYGPAIEQFTAARKIGEQMNDSQGLAFSDLRLCEARIALRKYDSAESACDSALRLFKMARSADEVKETQGLQARIDLARGRSGHALTLLNQVLDRNGADMLPRRVASLYQWRSRANAELHKYRDAYEDLKEFVRRNAQENDATRTRQSAALRARFSTDREIERNALLKRELEISQLQSLRQAQKLRWNAIVTVSGVVVIALLAYFLLVNHEYRKKLLKLASQDGLTGLPNRRSTAAFATAALAAATAERPLTIAIIDMDHFKIINDRCGHATGDYVLKEFARLGRESLRSTDLLGRWGGEEFLLIMPDTTLEFAADTLDRIRSIVLGIRLPPSSVGLGVSLSAGLATNERHGRTLDEMIARADSALYTAKNAGRNLVRVADEDYLSTTAIRRAILRP